MFNFKTKAQVRSENTVKKIGETLYSTGGVSDSYEEISLSGSTSSGSFGSAAFSEVFDFATSGQGSLAETAVQPGDLNESAFTGEIIVDAGTARPLAPYRPVSSLSQSSTKPLSMQVEDDLLYVYYQQGHVVDIVDVSSPETPQTLATHSPIGFGNTNMAVVRSGIMYTAATSNSVVRAADLTNITSFTESSAFSTNGAPFGLDIYQDYLYVAGSAGGGVAIHDVSTFGSLPKVANTDNFGGAGDCKVAKDHLFTTDFSDNEVRVYDLANPTSPVLVSGINIGTMPVWMH